MFATFLMNSMQSLHLGEEQRCPRFFLYSLWKSIGYLRLRFLVVLSIFIGRVHPNRDLISVQCGHNSHDGRTLSRVLFCRREGVNPRVLLNLNKHNPQRHQLTIPTAMLKLIVIVLLVVSSNAFITSTTLRNPASELHLKTTGEVSMQAEGYPNVFVT